MHHHQFVSRHHAIGPFNKNSVSQYSPERAKDGICAILPNTVARGYEHSRAKRDAFAQITLRPNGAISSSYCLVK